LAGRLFSAAVPSIGRLENIICHRHDDVLPHENGRVMCPAIAASGVAWRTARSAPECGTAAGDFQHRDFASDIAERDGVCLSSAALWPQASYADWSAVRQPQLDRIICASSARAASISHARCICRGERDETAARTSLAVLASISGY
jgi:hypothetical protein